VKRAPRTASLFLDLPQVPRQRPAPAPRAPLPPAVPREAPRELWAAVQLPQAIAPAAAGPLLAQWAQQAQRYTPRVSLEPPDALLLELRGSLALFGGLAALLGEIKFRFASASMIAMAPTPLAALALARAGKSCCLTDQGRLVSRLAPLPLNCLRWPEQSIARLFSMGVRTIGEVLRLPRAGFAQRMGTALLDDLDRLVGRRADPRCAYTPPERFAMRCEPSFEFSSKKFVLQTIGPALASLESFLRERQRGVMAVLLKLEHRGRPATRCVLRLASPEHRATQFASLLESQLQRLVLPAPVRRCELRSGPLLEYAAASEGLWQPGEQGGGAGARMPAFIERLRARLGPEAVQGLCLVPGHRPECLSGSTEPALRGAARKPVPRAIQPPWAPGRRPLWLLREPATLGLSGDGSGYPVQRGQKLRILSGPERLESGWWDGSDIQRDYYVASDARGARLWIFRERSGAQGWFLHGLFG
jgi:protein ImuB